MNITHQDMWPQDTDISHLLKPSPQTLKNLFQLRYETFSGFSKIEQEKGFIQCGSSLSFPKGQEMARILLLRSMEELSEAADSTYPQHFYEELVDALNYAWSIPLLNKKEIPPTFYHLVMASSNSVKREQEAVGRLIMTASPETFIGRYMMTAAPLLEKLRNRAWMNNSQSMYFEGWPELTVLTGAATYYVTSQFESWKQFVQYFVAKNNVLQFRLSTNY